jgi:hypothetical protein
MKWTILQYTEKFSLVRRKCARVIESIQLKQSKNENNKINCNIDKKPFRVQKLNINYINKNNLNMTLGSSQISKKLFITKWWILKSRFENLGTGPGPGFESQKNSHRAQKLGPRNSPGLGISRLSKKTWEPGLGPGIPRQGPAPGPISSHYVSFLL